MAKYVPAKSGEVLARIPCSNNSVLSLLTFVMVFFFLRDRRLPLLIGLVLPVSLAVTFLGFYGLGLTINTVALS